MMNAFSPLGTGLHVQALFGLATLVGFVLIIVWSARFASRDQLRSLISWLLAIGIIGSLLATPFMGGGFRWMMSRGGFESFGGCKKQQDAAGKQVTPPTGEAPQAPAND
ncbi:MAG: hypothetical protein PHI23_04010 [Candidatus Peribacteraceae bacterium]|nr:hypothetical protein [Candidatus Peribacteraceae bacterium]